MYLYLVEFACFRGDEPRFYLLDDKKYDDWITAEPPEGYERFKTVWNGEVEMIISARSGDAREVVGGE